jgi:hypothetical protein
MRSARSISYGMIGVVILGYPHTFVDDLRGVHDVARELFEGIGICDRRHLGALAQRLALRRFLDLLREATFL